MSTIAHDAHSAAYTRAEPRAISAVDVGLLALRLALGVIFFAHGAQKVLGWFGGHGLSATVAGMGHMGIPAPLAYLAIAAEFLGGLGLIFGVLARLSALGILVDMVVAVLLVHASNGFFMNWETQAGHVAPHGEGFEYHLLAIAIALMVLLAGPGRLALMDAEGRLFGRRPPE